jgi:hypothetical protein
LRIPVMSLFHFYSHSFWEAIIYLPSFSFWHWNGNYALRTAVTYAVAFIDSSFVWQFFSFFFPLSAPLFSYSYVAFRTCAFISHKQTNKHDGGGGVVAKQTKNIIFLI